MRAPRRVTLGTALTVGSAVLFALERAGARRWRPSPDAETAGPELPADVVHHVVHVSDGGLVHVAERGTGDAVVLVHGIALGIGIWAPQLRMLDGRIVAVSMRGHGRSLAGSEGYGFDRLGADLLEVLEHLDVRDAVLVGHSMGGMVSQRLAASRAEDLARHVRRLVLVATSPGPILPIGLGPLLGPTASWLFGAARSRPGLPATAGTTAWAARAAFGRTAEPLDVQLVCEMLERMSPAALAGLVPHLLGFDVRALLGAVRLPTAVVCGSRDLLTPVRTARAILAAMPVAPGSSLDVYAGCGHMVMMERAEELCALLR